MQNTWTNSKQFKQIKITQVRKLLIKPHSIYLIFMWRSLDLFQRDVWKELRKEGWCDATTSSVSTRYRCRRDTAERSHSLWWRGSCDAAPSSTAVRNFIRPLRAVSFNVIQSISFDKVSSIKSIQSINQFIMYTVCL